MVERIDNRPIYYCNVQRKGSMDTDRFLHIDDFLHEGFRLWKPNLVCDVQEAIEIHVRFTFYAQELEQLFQIFNFNLNQLINNYTFLNDDRFISRRLDRNKHSDFVAINSLIINYISAGKALVESLDRVAKKIFQQNSKELIFWEDFRSKLYDNNYMYQILLSLRDFAQHGHVPVSISGTQVSVDVKQLLETPHFKMKAKHKTRLESFKNAAIDMNSYPHLNITLSLAEFELVINELYLEMLKLIKKEISRGHDIISKLIADQSGKDQYSHLLYKLDKNNEAHAIPIPDNSRKMMERFIEEANIKYSAAKKEYGTLKNSMTFIKICETSTAGSEAR